MKSGLFVVCIMFLCIINSYANYIDTTYTEIEKQSGLIPLPLIIYTPETKFAVILAGLYYKHFDTARENAKPLELNGFALYSQKKQFILQLDFIHYFSENQFLIKADGMYDRYVDNYWGIGPSTLEKNQEEFTFDQVRLRAGLLYQLLDKVYGGLNFHYYKYYNMKLEQDKELMTKQILGYDGTTISGPGIQMFADKTNSAFFPTEGLKLDFKYNYFFKALSSSSEFWRAELDFRYFYELLENNVLAFNTVLIASGGDIPFVKLPLLGGNQINRGFNEGRYRDKLLYAGQLEYRFPVYWRFAGAGFMGIGDVASEINDLELDNMKLTYGIGIRFIADKKERIAIRLDIANSSQGMKFYLNIKEAF